LAEPAREVGIFTLANPCRGGKVRERLW